MSKFPTESLAKTKKRADEIFKVFAKANPNPKCELFYRTPFQLLVSVVLSAQTTDKSVNRAMQSIYEKGFEPEDVIALGQKKFKEIIKRIGLAPTKAKNVLGIAKAIIEEHGGEVPGTREELEALPGVGRKTASVILAELFHQPTLAVDTHVFRVAKRLGLHHQAQRDKAEQEILKVIDRKFLPAAHHWLILHGRYTCKARKPACGVCAVAHLCPSRDPLPSLRSCSGRDVLTQDDGMF